MKKRLKITLIILVMILICLIGFGGIYIKSNGIFKNILPDYDLGTKLEGTRLTTYKLDDTTNKVIYDSEGNIVNEIPEGENEENYKTEETPVNSDEIKTVENYKIAKEIMVKRLKSLGISNYEVRLDEETGNISVEINENKNTDYILSELTIKGKFEIIDADDKTVLMDTKDIKSATVFYNNTTSGISVYLDIQFTKEGTEKFAQISRDYPAVSNSNDENTENKQKKITINIDGQEFLSTAFNNVIENGELTVTIGSASKDTETVTDYITSAQQYATILNNGEMPLQYKIDTNESEYIKSIYSESIYIYTVLGVFAGIALISIIYMIIKYKKLGLLASIVYIATFALITILARYTEIQINIETIISAILILILMDYINIKVLRNIDKEDKEEERKEKLKNAYKKSIDVLIIILIPAIILTYNSLSRLSNIGMTLFWGIVITVILNIIFTREMLLLDAKNKD